MGKNACMIYSEEGKYQEKSGRYQEQQKIARVKTRIYINR